MTELTLADDAAGRLCASIVPLTRGRFAIIDELSEGEVAAKRWCFHWTGYAVRMLTRGGGKQQMISMHRAIMDAPDGSEVDHRNGRRFDNRRSNLRLCTPAQNQQNRHLLSRNKSGFRGVHWCKQDKKWKAAIRVFGKKVHLGYHLTPEAAARAYDAAALEHFGEFAQLNFTKEMIANGRS